MVIVAALLISIGFILLVIPGIVIGILLIYAFSLLVIRGYSGIDAIRESIEIAKTNFADTLILAVVICVINAIGSYVGIAGYFITLPITAIALTIATKYFIEECPDEYAEYVEIT
jgi:uncharacterized membrane protein